MAMGTWLERRFVFYECVPKLQNMASQEVALHLWRNYFSLVKCGKIQVKTGRRVINEHQHINFSKTAGKRYYFYSCLALGLDEDYKDGSDKLVKSLKIPRLIEEMLKESLDCIRNEMENLICHFEENIFDDGLKRYYLQSYNPNRIVWHQNGKIDYKASASKMLFDENLKPEQKFIIMCFYGMVDEIKQFPASSLPDYFRQQRFPAEISYWFYCLKEELYNMVREIEREYSAMFPDEEYPSVDIMMAILCAKRGRSLPYALEYFWNRLNENDQVLAAVKILPESVKDQKFILTRMSLLQQCQLVDQIPIILMMNFCEEFDMPDNAFLVWTRIKDRITGEEFSQFLGNVFCWKKDSEKCMIMLSNVWDSASDHLRKHAARMMVDPMFISFQIKQKCSPSGFRFFIKFLSMVNGHTRNQMILAESSHIFVQIVDDLDIMIEILNLCIPLESDILKFKGSIMRSSMMMNCCTRLFKDLKFDELITKVAFYSPNAYITREFINELLKPDKFDVEIWRKLNAFVDATFSTNLLTACELRRQLILSKKP